jgi:hypothetical protein
LVAISRHDGLKGLLMDYFFRSGWRTVNERGEARDVTVGAPATGDSTSMLGWLDRWRRHWCRVRRERGKAAAALRRVGAAARLPCAGLGDTMIGWRFGLFGLYGYCRAFDWLIVFRDLGDPWFMSPC